MSKPLIELLWRDRTVAPSGRRGPRARYSTGDVVRHASALADRGGLDAVTIRAVAESLGVSPMSVYTHVNSRDDLLVLMADAAYAEARRPPHGRAGWRTRVRRLAQVNLDLLLTRPWLLGVTDLRLALGPGTIAKYDHELHAFDGTGLGDVERDAALTFVLDFVRATAAAVVATAQAGAFDATWESSAEALTRHLGDDYPLARRVGRAAGERMGAPYDAHQAWEFGLARVLAGLADLIEG